jgi:hypothetical protein
VELFAEAETSPVVAPSLQNFPMHPRRGNTSPPRQATTPDDARHDERGQHRPNSGAAPRQAYSHHHHNPQPMTRAADGRPHTGHRRERSAPGSAGTGSPAAKQQVREVQHAAAHPPPAQHHRHQPMAFGDLMPFQPMYDALSMPAGQYSPSHAASPWDATSAASGISVRRMQAMHAPHRQRLWHTPGTHARNQAFRPAHGLIA